MEHDEIRTIYAGMLGGNNPPVSDLEPPFRYLRMFLPEDKQVPILDAGCGNGRYASKLARDGYSNIDAVDLFEEQDTRGVYRYHCGSIGELQFDDESFDMVYSLSVIYYLDDPRGALREYFRVMRPGARLVLSAHTKYSIHTLDRRIRRHSGGAEHLNGVKFSSANAYAAMLRECGFEVSNLWGYGLSYPKGNPLAKARRKFFTRKYPEAIRNALRLPRWMQLLVSNVGYHSLIAAQKPVVK